MPSISSFPEGYNEAFNFYPDDQLQERIENARELLDDTAIPRFHQIKTWLLLGACMGDWFEANTCCVKAKIIRSTVRSWHPFGVDLEIDKRIEELLANIEELRLALDQADDNPGNYDFEAHVSQGIASHKAAVEQAREGMYVKDPAELEEADSMELNIPVEDLRKLDPKKSHPLQIAEPGDAPAGESSESGGRDRPPFTASEEMGMAVRPRVGLGEYHKQTRYRHLQR
ncbi:hypothetical protein LTR17_002627 [Elasticomyces elasticus]|nr:hypothetical protein LTR17_002627 [Elasticomyces elasticus]